MLQAKPAQQGQQFLNDNDSPSESDADDAPTDHQAVCVCIEKDKSDQATSTTTTGTRTCSATHELRHMDHGEQEILLRIQPRLDPNDWILEYDDCRQCFMYTVSKLWSWEQIKRCIANELRQHASCLPREDGELTDYYHRPLVSVSSSNDEHNHALSVVNSPPGCGSKQARPICNQSDFLQAIEPRLSASDSTTASPHYTLNMLVTCKPLHSREEIVPSSTVTRSFSYMNDSTTTLSDIGMAQALIGLRQTAIVADPIAMPSNEIIPDVSWSTNPCPSTTIRFPSCGTSTVGTPFHGTHKPTFRNSSSRNSSIDIWNGGPNGNRIVRRHNSILHEPSDEISVGEQKRLTASRTPVRTTADVYGINLEHDDDQVHKDDFAVQQPSDRENQESDLVEDTEHSPSRSTNLNGQKKPPRVETTVHRKISSKERTNPNLLRKESHLKIQAPPCGIESYTKSERVNTSIPVLKPYDVLCSRSKVAFRAIGNRRLRIIMELMAPTYEDTPRKVGKTAMVTSLVKLVQRAGGNFIRQDKETGEWEIAPNNIAKEKVGHGLRDAVSNRNRTIYDILGHENYSRKSTSGTADPVSQKSPLNGTMPMKLPQPPSPPAAPKPAKLPTPLKPEKPPKLPSSPPVITPRLPISKYRRVVLPRTHPLNTIPIRFALPPSMNPSSTTTTTAASSSSSSCVGPIKKRTYSKLSPSSSSKERANPNNHLTAANAQKEDCITKTVETSTVQDTSDSNIPSQRESSHMETGCRPPQKHCFVSKLDDFVVRDKVDVIHSQTELCNMESNCKTECQRSEMRVSFPTLDDVGVQDKGDAIHSQGELCNVESNSKTCYQPPQNKIYLAKMDESMGQDKCAVISTQGETNNQDSNSKGGGQRPQKKVCWTKLEESIARDKVDAISLQSESRNTKSISINGCLPPKKKVCFSKWKEVMVQDNIP